jgi:uncharacterized protein YjbI with pentapeptide repeats
MANEEHVERLKQGVDVWNQWRKDNPDICPDLRRADLFATTLAGANLSRANLAGADLYEADLSEADLSEADLVEADLTAANLTGANLSEADLFAAELSRASLPTAELARAKLSWATLVEANLSGASLSGANLIAANLSRANLASADLAEADLSRANLVEVDFRNANLTGCKVYGVSAWKLNLNGAKQESLVITDRGEPEVTVDDIEVAQFVYLLLHNPKIRNVIDTIGQKAVLILGRFTPERKKVLDALREELRKRDYVPILFDFDKPASQDLTATVSTLAHMARFIIADLTDPSSIPYELATVVPTTPVPVQPILLSGQSEFAMFVDLQRRYRWVLAPHCYEDRDQLITELNEWVIRPAERKVLELRGEAKEVP